MTISTDELQYWVAFSRIPRIGAVRAAALEAYFGSLAEAWRAGARDLRAAGLDRGHGREHRRGAPSISPEDEIEKLEKAGVKAYSWRDPAYPPG